MSGMFKKQKKLKFILLGPKDSGKTTILYKQQLHKTVDTMPTADFYTEDLNISTSSHKTKCTVLDVGGQLFKLWLDTPEQLDGIIWVQDACDKNGLDETCAMFQKVVHHPKGEGVPLLVFANKSECEGALPIEKIQEKLQLSSLKTRKWKILACSATTGHNLDAGFQWLTETSLDFKKEQAKNK